MKYDYELPSYLFNSPHQVIINFIHINKTNILQLKIYDEYGELYIILLVIKLHTLC